MQSSASRRCRGDRPWAAARVGLTGRPGVAPRLAVLLGAALLAAACGGPQPPSSPATGAATFAPTAAATPTSAHAPGRTPSVTPIPAWVDPPDEGVDEAVPTEVLPATLQLYPGQVSVTPGQPISLHVSTPALTYRIQVFRQGWLNGVPDIQVFRQAGLPGRDQRWRAMWDPSTGLVRAGWLPSIEIDTTGWAPGIYLARGQDSRGNVDWAPFVVRTPVISHDRPLFVFTSLTYQAYNSWGGTNVYSRPPAVRLGFDRPIAQYQGRGTFDRADSKLVHWLEEQGYALQYATDYDLSIDPPAVAPSLLIVPMHMEYVPGALRDWLDQHVNIAGDMNLAHFGANSVYWQIRLTPGPDPSRPQEIVAYKNAAPDPAAASHPALETVRWRDPPVNRPEGMLFGSQYVGILGDGRTSRFDFTVEASAPPELLAGTGWRPGDPIRGLLVGEGDGLYPGSGAISVLSGSALDKQGLPLSTNVVVRTSPAGARVFSVGSFQWADGFSAAARGLDIGVSQASFVQFNMNVLDWLGLPPPGG